MIYAIIIIHDYLCMSVHTFSDQTSQIMSLLGATSAANIRWKSEAILIVPNSCIMFAYSTPGSMSMHISMAPPTAEPPHQSHQGSEHGNLGDGIWCVSSLSTHRISDAG